VIDASALWIFASFSTMEEGRRTRLAAPFPGLRDLSPREARAIGCVGQRQQMRVPELAVLCGRQDTTSLYGESVTVKEVQGM
jgi:hypothetical protein